MDAGLVQEIGPEKVKPEIPSWEFPAGKNGQPPIPKMRGLMNPNLWGWRDDDITLIRCVIEPSKGYDA